MASVIVRAKDEVAKIEQALTSVRQQTVSAELIVVDSGSTDGTLAIAHRLADRVIEIPPERFTYGYSLNVGASAATAPLHVALSAHCQLPRTDWLATAADHYRRADVAATHGVNHSPGGGALAEVFYQDYDFQYAHPYWGFSNHASSWRAGVWERFPFDEQLPAAEDKEWAWRVLAAGNVIACDPALVVDGSHQWSGGIRALYERARMNGAAYAMFCPESIGRRDISPPWSGLPIRQQINPRRYVQRAGTWAGYRSVRRHPGGDSAGGSVNPA